MMKDTFNANLSAAAKKRRAKLLAEKQTGKTIYQLANKYGVSAQRISYLLARARED